MGRIKTVGLDLDGTVLTTWTDQIHPLAVPRLAELRGRGVDRLFIATNQGGPTWRLMTGSETFPTAERVAGNLAAAWRAVKEISGLPLALYVATYAEPKEGDFDRNVWRSGALQAKDALLAALASRIQGCVVVVSSPRFRKPDIGMIRLAKLDWSARTGETLYIGDMASDAEAAQNAGVRFLHADDWHAGRWPEEV